MKIISKDVQITRLNIYLHISCYINIKNTELFSELFIVKYVKLKYVILENGKIKNTVVILC